MQKEILSDRQKELLPFLKNFKREYYLVDGTAIALFIGHRRSIDFDLFTHLPINKKKISNGIQKLNVQVQPIYFDVDQQHYLINEVKCTFFHYPYPIEHPKIFENIISLPSLPDLAAMTAYALGRRSKWKDYVDLYFILKEHYTMGQIIERAKYYFPDQISEKLFRNQLAFHKDIDFTEEVDFMMDKPPTQKEIKDFLIDVATQPF